MVNAADAGRAVAQHAWAGLCEGDQFFEAAGLEVRVYCEVQRRDSQQRDRNEILLSVERGFRVDELLYRQHRSVGDHECVAVRRRLSQGHCGHRTARAGLVVHHERLAERLGELLRNDASDRIWQTPCDVWHQQPHWLGRIALCMTGVQRSERGRHHDGRQQGTARELHELCVVEGTRQLTDSREPRSATAKCFVA
ncbi:hypothetical protein D3C87_1323670 [compost metagenome]